MLQLFKQPETTGTRQLQECCHQLLGKNLTCLVGVALSETVSGAIADVQNKYHTLALIVIKSIKQSQELVTAGREAEITISEQQALSVATFSVDQHHARKLNDNNLLETKPSADQSLDEAEINSFRLQ